MHVGLGYVVCECGCHQQPVRNFSEPLVCVIYILCYWFSIVRTIRDDIILQSLSSEFKFVKRINCFKYIVAQREELSWCLQEALEKYVS